MNFIPSKAAKGAAALSLAVVMALPALAGCSMLKAKSEALVSDLSKIEYHISVGFCCDKDVSSISQLIKKAEQEMYDEKRKYYEKSRSDRQKSWICQNGN